MAVSYTAMDSPIGRLWLAATPVGLCRVGLGHESQEELVAWLTRHLGPGAVAEDAPVLAEAQTQLREYFSRLRRSFDLPLDLRGTPFQREVWAAVACIPYGQTITYGDLAQRLGRGPGSARAVGSAVGANPLPILIPCHRVVGAGGSLVGYGGGLEAKAVLLRLEGVAL